MLSQEQVEQFRQNGYVAVRDVVSSETLQRLREAAGEMLEESRRLSESLEPDHCFEHPRLRQIRHPVAERPIFWEVATSDTVLGGVEAIIGHDIKFHHSKMNMKVDRGGTEIGWHQDFAFFPHTNFDLVACGLALDDSTVENGCLLVAPGTHRIGLLNHRDENGEFIGKITSDADRFDAEKAVAVELRAGDMSIHHVAVVHGSLQNQSSRSRRLLVFQYAACDAIQLDKRPPANAFSERVVRGQAPSHARLAGSMVLPLRGDLCGARSLFDRQLKKNGELMAPVYCRSAWRLC
jgi:phytanoyl-CoA hydroxylase